MRYSHQKTCSFYRPITLFLILIVTFMHSELALGQVSDNPRIKFFDEAKFVSHGYPLASSPPLARNLAENEELIYIIMKDFYERYGSQDNIFLPPNMILIPLMQDYFIDFEASVGEHTLELKNDEEYANYSPYKTVWNPLTSYRMFRRLVKALREIVRSFDTTKEAEFALQKQIFNIMRNTGWPQQSDLNVTLHAILRLQEVYDLKTYELSFGTIADLETNVILSAMDCLEIGKQALEESYFALAVEWFEIAQYKNDYIYDDYERIDEATIENYLKHSQEKHDHHWHLNDLPHLNFFTEPIKNGTSKQVQRRTAVFQAWKDNPNPDLNRFDYSYWGTCSGENYKSESEKSKLFCWYETEISHSFKINPLKVELLSIETVIVLRYHDIIGEKMMEKLKQETTQSLARSTLSGENGKRIILPSRTSLSSKLGNNTAIKFNSLNRTIEAVTGLNVGKHLSSEHLQVAAYTTGSHYLTHLDAFDNDAKGIKLEKYGNRIATFMYYLSDVEKGGGTSFPVAGIAVEPIKGSAVLWFNLLRNGEVDKKTYHGACPVIIGEKWIANKWIRSHEQMFLKYYQCSPDQDATVRLPINGKDLMDFL